MTVVPFSVHSHFSLMQGTAAPKRLCRKARKQGYRRLALTDTDALYGLWPFLEGCREEGITPIIGAVLTDPASKGRAVCLVENDFGIPQPLPSHHTTPMPSGL